MNSNYKKMKKNFFISGEYGYSLIHCEFLKENFNQARSHTNISTEPSTANFFCRGTIEVNEVSTLELEKIIEEKPIWHAFWETQHLVKFDSKEERAIKLLLGGTYIGHYLIDKNILVASDLVHSRKYLKTTKEICKIIADLNYSNLLGLI
jgi:hypothetical protein